MKPLFILGHLGLGDTIICNGMVRELAKEREIFWAVKPHNFVSVRDMFEDLPKVWCWQVRDDMEARADTCRFEDSGVGVLRLGVHSGQPLARQWDKQMYKQAGVPFDKRWSGFVAPRQHEARITADCPFVHEDPKRGFKLRPNLRPKQFHMPALSRSIWDHLGWLESAPEIHVIDSAFLCLADSVPTVATRLVFHKYARPGGRAPTLRKAWEIVE